MEESYGKIMKVFTDNIRLKRVNPPRDHIILSIHELGPSLTSLTL